MNRNRFAEHTMYAASLSSFYFTPQSSSYYLFSELSQTVKSALLKFHAKNTDPERSYLNVEYYNENIKDIYHELFDEAFVQYKEKQVRNDGQIDDHYEKILSSKQEKSFHGIIVQIGDKNSMATKTEKG